jgi:enoyl-CoA hydratase
MLRVEREGATAVFTIVRPEAKNALDEKTLRALGTAASEASSDESIRAVIVCGEGDAFCAGGDLGELRTWGSAKDAEALTDLGADVMGRLASLPVLTLAAIQGPAFGGGAELALACDVRIVSGRAKISFKQARMGATTAWGTAERLLALVGTGAAHLLLLTGMEVGAERAIELGLAEVIAENALEAAHAIADEAARCGPRASAEIKALLRSGGERSLERAAFIRTWSSEEHAAAVRAYFAGRGST